MLYQILLYVLIALVAVALLMLLRARKIKEKYVWIWLFLDFLALVVLLLPSKTIDSIAKYMGFVYGSSMVFTAVITVLVVTAIQQASALSRLEEEKRCLVEEIAILNNRVDALDKATQNSK